RTDIWFITLRGVIQVGIRRREQNHRININLLSIKMFRDTYDQALQNPGILTKFWNRRIERLTAFRLPFVLFNVDLTGRAFPVVSASGLEAAEESSSDCPVVSTLMISTEAS